MSMKLEGFKVRCRSCGTVLYETTEHYNCHKPLTGDMLRLLPLYKYWPTYDGSLATESTSRFLMFCSNCSGYISTTGKLFFADFSDVKVTEISEERSKLVWRETGEPIERAHALHDKPISKAELPTSEAGIFTPNDLMKKIEKEASSLSFEPKAGEALVASDEMKKLFQKKNKKRRKKRK